MLLALAPALTFHFFAVVVIVVAACAVVFWILRRTAIPEPFNYVLYAALALLALWVLFSLLAHV